MEGNIKAVHDDDIFTLFRSLGVLEKFNNGDAYCAICHTRITFDTFQALFPLRGEVAFCCDDPSCYMSILREI